MLPEEVLRRRALTVLFLTFVKDASSIQPSKNVSANDERPIASPS